MLKNYVNSIMEKDYISRGQIFLQESTFKLEFCNFNMKTEIISSCYALQHQPFNMNEWEYGPQIEYGINIVGGVRQHHETFSFIGIFTHIQRSHETIGYMHLYVQRHDGRKCSNMYEK